VIGYFEKKKKERKIIKDEDVVKTVDEVMDSFTNYHIYKLVNKKVIKDIKGSISGGKESKVYWGRDWNSNDIAIKIYLTSSAEFRKGIKEYIFGDPRFKRLPNKFRSIIYLWAKKEFNNLVRLKNFGISVPRPISLSGNVLVMEFLGERGYRAPLLSEIYKELSKEELLEVYRQVKENLIKMVCNSRIVHADLSEFNLVYWKNKVYIIDVSQSVEIDHPKSLDFLERDIKNVYKFFSKLIDIGEYDSLEGDVKHCIKMKIQGK